MSELYPLSPFTWEISLWVSHALHLHEQSGPAASIPTGVPGGQEPPGRLGRVPGTYCPMTACDP